MKVLREDNLSRDRAELFAACYEHSVATKRAEVSADWISAIRNLVCPQCGGRMGGRTKEFRCQGQCGTDWRSVWETSSSRSRRPHWRNPVPSVNENFVSERPE
jgi:tRNA(Ile2) C34 agmatinyltransferase TiaS